MEDTLNYLEIQATHKIKSTRRPIGIKTKNLFEINYAVQDIERFAYLGSPVTTESGSH